MMWFSAIFLGLLTYHAWQTARDMKTDGENAGLRRVVWLAFACGLVGTICFALAAII